MRSSISYLARPPRKPEQMLEQRHMDLAASIQAVTEEVVLRLTRSLATETGEKNLCIAGGVALNCVANGKMLRDGRFEGIFIQPAAGDAGGALGAALAAYHHQKEQPRRVSPGKDAMKGSFLGPSYQQSDIEHRLNTVGAKFHVGARRDADRRDGAGPHFGKSGRLASGSNGVWTPRATPRRCRPSGPGRERTLP